MTLFRHTINVLIAILLFAGTLSAAEEPAAAAATATHAVAVTSAPAPATPPAISLQPSVQMPTLATEAKPALRIGYADLLKIGAESLPGKAAEARFKTKADKFKKQISDKEKQLEKQKKAIEEKLPLMSPEERANKGKEFEKKVDEYRKFVQKAQKEMEPLQQELSLSIYSIMESAAREYGRSKGLMAIVPKKELLYLGDAVEAVDVTDDLLKLINERDTAKK
jgi:outer membrane protein